SNVVRPEEAGPQISVRQPRGRPPVNASNSAMPREPIAAAGHNASREAGVTPASLESFKDPEELAGITLRGGRPSPKSSAPLGCRHSTTSSPSKTKGRP